MTELPNDLHDFLSHGGQLEFDPDSSAIGAIKLKSLEDVSESIISVFPGSQSIVDDPYESLDGTYGIPVFNLIAECEEYDPDGLLCWIPILLAYGAVDPEHGDIIAFPRVTWSTIAADPVDYLDAQWGLLDYGEHVFPWLHFQFQLDDESTADPYPDSCPLHNRAIARRSKTRHRLFEVFRDEDVEQWLDVSRKSFPFAGIPASESELICCDKCFDAEHRWTTEIEAMIPLVDAKMNSGGFVQCPRCKIRFSPNSPDVFADQVHLTCGQKINVLESDLT